MSGIAAGLFYFNLQVLLGVYRIVISLREK